MKKQKSLSQFFTPVWAAEILFNEHFSHLTERDIVWEPSCGKGSFLSVIPKHVKAIGSDIDPEMVKLAAVNTGRPIYNGDFRDIVFDGLNNVTAIIGNPPFICDVFEEFMQRCENILTIGKKAGFILPAYFFQTSRTFMRFARHWEISQEIIPRDLFKGEGLLSKPLIWASFIRENSPKIIGFRLHAELCDVDLLKESVRQMLNEQVRYGGSIWQQAVINVTRDYGGIVTLDQLYRNMQGNRPTENPFWKEQVRKVVQKTPFERIDAATYKLMA